MKGTLFLAMWVALCWAIWPLDAARYGLALTLVTGLLGLAHWRERA